MEVLKRLLWLMSVLVLIAAGCGVEEADSADSPTKETFHDSENNTEINSQSPTNALDTSLYEGVWKYHFEENDENSGGYIVTLKPTGETTGVFAVKVQELSPGAAFINGSEGTIDLSSGKGTYEFDGDANDNAGLVEIELANGEIIYKKKMYTQNPGRFNEDLEVNLKKEQ